MPGAAGRDNWGVALPVPVEDLPQHATAVAVADCLDQAVRRIR